MYRPGQRGKVATVNVVTLRCRTFNLAVIGRATILMMFVSLLEDASQLAGQVPFIAVEN